MKLGKRFEKLEEHITNFDNSDEIVDVVIADHGGEEYTFHVRISYIDGKFTCEVENYFEDQPIKHLGRYKESIQLVTGLCIGLVEDESRMPWHRN